MCAKEVSRARCAIPYFDDDGEGGPLAVDHHGHPPERHNLQPLQNFIAAAPCAEVTECPRRMAQEDIFVEAKLERVKTILNVTNASPKAATTHAQHLVHH